MTILLGAGAFAKPGQDSISSQVDRVYAQQAARLKPYYVDSQTARTCESWRSCAVWAFGRHLQDSAFKIVRAEIKTQRKVYRHHVARETSLFVEATYQNRTIYVEFITPRLCERGQSYYYISTFPQ